MAAHTPVRIGANEPEVYELETLERYIKTQGLFSPLTRKPFSYADIHPAQDNLQQQRALLAAARDRTVADAIAASMNLCNSR